MTTSPIDRLTSEGDAYRDRVARRGEYADLVTRLHASVPGLLPASARVLIVSRGDQGLLAIPGIEGSHFPQAADGQYAGHYPQDSAAAIEHLEAARAAGGQFLLFPATSFWWLDHYSGFRGHLDANYKRVRDDVDCLIFDLRADEDSASMPRAVHGHQDVEWGQIIALVEAILPPAATLAVLDGPKADAPSIGEHPVRMIAIPEPAGGEDAPPKVSDISARLGSAAREGVDYMILPHRRARDPALARVLRLALEARYRPVLRHADVCAIFDTRQPAQRP